MRQVVFRLVSLKSLQCTSKASWHVSRAYSQSNIDITKQLSRLTTHFISRDYCVNRQDRKCWKCNSSTNKDTELYFCHCGVVQTVPTDFTLFEAMRLDESFDIDTAALSVMYKDLQRELHPDKFTLKTKVITKIYYTVLNNVINKAIVKSLMPVLLQSI